MQKRRWGKGEQEQRRIKGRGGEWEEKERRKTDLQTHSLHLQLLEDLFQMSETALGVQGTLQIT